MEPRVLLDGLAMPESPRWHDGRLWFSNWGADEIVAVDLDIDITRSTQQRTAR
jgi:sugar lactone lactonase YvrE